MIPSYTFLLGFLKHFSVVFLRLLILEVLQEFLEDFLLYFKRNPRREKYLSNPLGIASQLSEWISIDDFVEISLDISQGALISAMISPRFPI